MHFRPWVLLLLTGCAGGEVVATGPPAPTLGPAGAESGSVAIATEARVEVVVTAPPACADADARAEAWYDEEVLSTEPSRMRWVGGAGLAVGDLGGDARQEIVASTDDTVFLFRPTDVGYVREVVFHAERTNRHLGDWRDFFHVFHGITLADVDGDADLDVFVTGNHRANVLLRNDGDTFRDVAAEVGLAGDPALSRSGAAWADMDGDGDLDVIVGGHGNVRVRSAGIVDLAPDPSGLYENRGGVFVDVSDRLDPILGHDLVLIPLWHDLDDDGDLDLYVANDFGESGHAPRVLLQDAGRFVWREDPSLDVPITGMGLAARDLNGDGRLDFALAGFDRFALLMSASGGWVDHAAACGLTFPRPGLVPWGLSALDADNDGDSDLVAGFGSLVYPDGGLLRGTVYDPVPDALYVVGDDGRYEVLAAGQGLDHLGTTRGLVVADVDGDGWRDVVRAKLEGEVVVAHARCGTASWLTVGLHDAGANAFAVGARVDVVAGSHRLTRWVRAGGTGYASGAGPEVHFGLGAAEQVDEIVVTWPDGEVTVLDDVVARSRVDLVRSGLEVAAAP